jgi:hypothetical protein
VIGATLAPEWRADRLGATLIAFLLAVGIGAHSLDELNGRPLGTRVPAQVLIVLAATSIAAAVSIGVTAAAMTTLWLLPFVAFGCFIVVAYNLGLGGGRFHSDLWFATAWGAFPLLTAYFACAERLRVEAVVAAASAALASYAQRQLSTQVRTLRRRVTRVEGALESAGGRREPITREQLLQTPEEALRALSAATVTLAVALVVFRTV